MLNIGIIGVGNMGRHYVRILSEHPMKKEVFLFDTDKETAEALAQQYDCTACTSLSELVENVLDVVFIATPTPTHFAYLDYILSDTYAEVLVEKPLTLLVTEALMLERFSKRIMPGHIERFNPVVKGIHDLAFILGKVLSCNIDRIGLKLDKKFDTGVRLDLGIHDYDLISFLFGENINIVHNFTDAMDDLNITTLMCGDIHCTLHQNRISEYKRRRIEIVGTEGSITGDLIKQEITIHIASFATYERIASLLPPHSFDGEVINITYEKEEPLKAEIDAFLDAFLRMGTYPITFDDGIKALKLACGDC